MHSASWDFSVVIPLMDGRGDELECIRTWTHGQTYPRKRFQVILVASSDNDATFVRAAAELLQPHDRMVTASGPIHALYAAGAEAGEGTHLFFTELHCKGDPNCLQVVGQWLLENPGAAGACVGSNNLNLTWLGELEDVVIDALMHQWSEVGHWRRVLVRGTAIRRTAYDAAGGFDGELEYFADIALAAHLHKQGFQIGFIPDVLVTHINHATYASIREFSLGYAKGQHRFALRNGAGWEKYVHMPKTWRDALGDSRGRAWRDIGLFAKLLLQASVRPRRFCRLWKACRSTLGKGLTTALLGRGRRSRVLGVRILYRQLLIALPKIFGVNRAVRFGQTWDLGNEQELLRMAENEHYESPPLTIGVWGVKEIPALAWRDVHDLEVESGTAFRWTEPVSRLRCMTLPDRECELIVQLQDPSSAHRLLAVICDGQPISEKAVTQSNASLRIRLHASKESATRELLFVCTPFYPSSLGSTDQRALGLAISSFELRAVPGTRVSSWTARHDGAVDAAPAEEECVPASMH